MDSNVFHEIIKQVRPLTKREKQIIIAAFSDLENLVNQYREVVRWLTVGNLEASQRPIKQVTRERMKELRGLITDVLKDIESKTQ